MLTWFIKLVKEAWESPVEAQTTKLEKIEQVVTRDYTTPVRIPKHLPVDYFVNDMYEVIEFTRDTIIIDQFTEKFDDVTKSVKFGGLLAHIFDYYSDILSEDKLCSFMVSSPHRSSIYTCLVKKIVLDDITYLHCVNKQQFCTYNTVEKVWYDLDQIPTIETETHRLLICYTGGVNLIKTNKHDIQKVSEDIEGECVQLFEITPELVKQLQEFKVLFCYFKYDDEIHYVTVETTLPNMMTLHNWGWTYTGISDKYQPPVNVSSLMDKTTYTLCPNDPVGQIYPTNLIPNYYSIKNGQTKEVYAEFSIRGCKYKTKELVSLIDKLGIRLGEITTQTTLIITCNRLMDSTNVSVKVSPIHQLKQIEDTETQPLILKLSTTKNDPKCKNDKFKHVQLCAGLYSVIDGKVVDVRDKYVETQLKATHMYTNRALVQSVCIPIEHTTTLFHLFNMYGTCLLDMCDNQFGGSADWTGSFLDCAVDFTSANNERVMRLTSSKSIVTIHFDENNTMTNYNIKLR